MARSFAPAILFLAVACHAASPPIAQRTFYDENDPHDALANRVDAAANALEVAQEAGDLGILGTLEQTRPRSERAAAEHDVRLCALMIGGRKLLDLRIADEAGSVQVSTTVLGDPTRARPVHSPGRDEQTIGDDILPTAKLPATGTAIDVAFIRAAVISGNVVATSVESISLKLPNGTIATLPRSTIRGWREHK